jgi:hypothetical protein
MSMMYVGKSQSPDYYQADKDIAVKILLMELNYDKYP